MKFIFLGAPGAGKGTQAEVVCKKYEIPAISTGNILRAALKSGTETGLKAKEYMDRGDLVPDEVLIDIIKERLAEDDCANGFVLDGFPRTIPQAEALDNMGVSIDMVVDIEVADEEIVKRMSGRRVCEACGSSYHVIYKKPDTEGTCNSCSGTLIQRKDDHPDTVKDRLSVYHDLTEPLKAYYEKQGKLVIVEGQEIVADTTALLLKSIEENRA
jgi:adenylate kinases